jgi:Cu2+-containing amine oxidase
MNTNEKIRRGEVLVVWGALNAANYRYIMQYRFQDDGVVGFRLGATAHNLKASGTDETTHLHNGWWRLSPVLGDATRLKISEVALETSPTPKTVLTPVNSESKLRWQAERFTRLRVESASLKNDHDPAHPISYEIVPHSTGVGRYTGTGEGFTQYEFWITRAKTGEFRPRDLESYTNNESLADGAVSLWFQSALLHRVRDEDFGRKDTNNYEGLALTTWAGFDFKPRNFFPSTPLFP